MKLFKKTMLLSTIFFLASCGMAPTSEATSIDGGDDWEWGLDIDGLRELYGEGSLTDGDGNPVETNEGVYTLNVASSKQTFIIKGFLEGRIVIQNGDELSSYKGIKLKFEGGFLYATDKDAIEYTLSKKNVEIVPKNGTENYIVAKGESEDDDCVSSGNNIEFDGKGTINLFSHAGHTVNADGTIRLYEAPTINIVSAHDGMHADDLVSDNGEDSASVDYVKFSGFVNVNSAVSQAFDCSNSSGTGFITISGGTYSIMKSEAAFKTDTALTISSCGITVEQLTGDAVQKGDNAETLTITVDETATFLVDGEPYTSRVL